VAIALAMFVALAGFIPLVNLIPGGRVAEWYSPAIMDWLNGSLIAIGGGIVYAIAAHRYPIWREGLLGRLVDRIVRHPARALALLSGVAFLVYCAVSLAVFDGRPLLIDEIVQLLQARIYSEGQLARPVAAQPEFFSTLHVIDGGGRYFSQFPAGGPAMYVPGWVIGAPWLTNPLCATVSVALFARYAWLTERERRVAVGAILLFAFAPFAVFMSASHMNHVPTLMWTMVAISSLATVSSSVTARPGRAFLLGLGFGCAATIRPVDALSFAFPAGIWVLSRAVRLRDWRELVASAMGIALPVSVLLWINSRTTGSPFLFGYELLWGASHGLGFHRAPWGIAHTPARGVELINLYFLRLQNYLFESPIPSLLPVIASLGLTRKFTPHDRYWLASALILIVLYFAYWHDGFYLGPRFFFPLLPLFALWTARLPALVAARFGRGTVYRAVWGTLAISLLLAVGVSIPLRARQYSQGLLTMRWDADGAAERAGIRNALVFVRESWGSQLVARLWALGISRSDAELLYRNIDGCQLDSMLSELERRDVEPVAALAALTPLLRDSAAVVASPFSPDTTQGFRRGVVYTPRCLSRINEDRAGFTLMPPLLLSRRTDILYARDLHARDSLLIAANPDRAVYLLAPGSAEQGAPPRFTRLNPDSLLRVWRGGE
jgi:hypothetical protein